MGILDGITGQLFGNSSKENPLMDSLLGILGNQETGGLAGLVQQFSGKGLGDIVNSWVSTGKNLPITSQQIQKGLGSNVVAEIASKLGISPEDASGKIATLLPHVVDKLTPTGKIPEGDIMTQGMDLLKGLLK